MFQLFGQRQPQVLGIDIGTGSVRMLELSQHGSTIQIDCHAVETLPDGAVVAKDIQDVAAVAETIERLVKRARPSCHFAAVAVPASAVITKTIQVPANLSEDEVEAQLEFDAEKYIPYPIDEVSLDFQLIGPNADDDEQMDVLLVAARTEYVDSRIEAVEMGGLKPKVVDTEVYAIERGYTLLDTDFATEPAEQDEVVAVFDIGTTVTTLIVLQGGEAIYSREQNFGGRALIEDIQQVYGLNYQEATMARREGSLPEDYEATLLQPFREACVQQINRGLQLFYSSSEQHAINRVMLAGGCAHIDNLLAMVKEELEVDAGMVDLSSGLDVGAAVKQKPTKEDFSSLLICSGLAMRSFV